MKKEELEELKIFVDDNIQTLTKKIHKHIEDRNNNPERKKITQEIKKLIHLRKKYKKLNEAIDMLLGLFDF